MEYVKGVPITDYCDATRLSVEDRLNLFIQVCSAVQHAHQKGIIHRDLKPSNILVAPYDDKPVPKVIDCGLAKAMHQSLTERTLYTATKWCWAHRFTCHPNRPSSITSTSTRRSDIYSLGVLLYELLTGTTPLERQRFKEVAWDEIRRMIREEESPRPSTPLSSTDTLPSVAAFRHTEPAKLKKLVRGELDWIVMKALKRIAPGGMRRRAAWHAISSFTLTTRLSKRPPSTGYRIGKFVRRHRARVIAAGLVLLALLAGIAGTTWGLLREARVNARLADSLAREQIENADLLTANAKVRAGYNLAFDAIKAFHTGVSENFLLKEEQFKDSRNRLLKSASDFYGKLSRLLGTETDIASRRELAASNRHDEALATCLLARVDREALAAVPGASHLARRELAETVNLIGYVMWNLGRPAEAIHEFRTALAISRNLADEDPDVAEFRRGVGVSHFDLGDVLPAWRPAVADGQAGGGGGRVP